MVRCTEKVLFNDLVLAFKCVNGLAPDYFDKYFVKRSAVEPANRQPPLERRLYSQAPQM